MPEQGKTERSEEEITYSAYIFPSDPQKITTSDLTRFSPLPLGSEKEVRKWILQQREGKSQIPEPLAKRRFITFGDVVFYLVMVLLVLGTFLLKNAGNGAPTSFAGYSLMQVLSGSMESEIPKGSLVIAKQVEASELQIGDDITYLSGPATTITHRIVGIIENYADTGQRAFTTQGIMNSGPDSQPVPAVNVVGKVVFHNYILGVILGFIRENWMILLALLILVAGFFEALRCALQKGKTKAENRGMEDSL